MGPIEAPLVGHYDLRLTAFSAWIAISTSYAALDLGGRIAAARGWARAVWLAAGAIALGLGIWGMDFTGMLAFRLPVPVAYHLPTVLVSLIAAILASGIALHVASGKRLGLEQALTGSVLVGVGIAGMHYIGMSAMRFSAARHDNPWLVAAAVLIAMMASLAALAVTFHYRADLQGITVAKVLSAISLGAGISLVHYTGTASANFVVSAVMPDLSAAMSIPFLGVVGIAVGTLLVEGAAVATSAVDRKFAEQTLEVQTSERFRQVADTLPIVLALTNADLSEFLFVNRAYEEIWGRTVESLRADSMSFLEGVHSEDRERLQKALEGLIKGEPIEGLECRVVRSNGSMCWVLCRGFPVRDSQGQIVRLVGSAQDITEQKSAEEALRENEDRYRDLVEHSQDLICTHDPEGILLSVNEVPLRILGYSREELLNKPLRDFVTPAARPWCDAYLAKIQKDGFATGILPVLTKGGEVRLWEFNNSLRREGVSEPVVRGLAHDVTEQKRAEQALRRSEEKFSKAFRSSPVEIAITTLEEGRYLEANESVERNTGFSREELLGHTSVELGFWLDLAERAALVEDMRKNGRVTNRVIRQRAKSGEIAIKRYSAELIHINDQDCLLAVSQDITELKKAEERFKGLLQSAPDAMVIVNGEGRVVLINSQTEKLFGYSIEELLNQKVEMILPERYREKHIAHRRHFFDEPRVRPMGAGLELFALRKDGTEFPVEVSLSPLQTEEGVLVSSAIRDITERKRAQEELQRLSGRLLQSQDEERKRIARELHDSTGQDLVALATMLGQLRSRVPGVERKSRKLLSECKALADKCVRDVRTLSYVLHPPVLEQAGLRDAIHDYVNGFTKRSGIQVELEMPSRVGRLARDVELALFRVVQEGLTNVQRHSRSQHAKIRIDRNPDLILEISDSGNGVRDGETRRASEAPFQFGVGIPSMQERVMLIGGRLEINTTRSGTTVRVRIPQGGENEESSHSNS